MARPEQDWAAAAEAAILDRALERAPAQGWTRAMVKAAGAAAGLSEGETELLLPHGPQDLAALLSRRHDAAALHALSPIDPRELKVRERIRRAVGTRLDASFADEASARRWMGFLALPANLGLAGQLAWESADALWRWAGDTATDENHYSKRAILAGILSAAAALRLSAGRAEAMAFVDRRIENVMAYESWKARSGFRPSELLARFARTLGRVRYPAGPKAAAPD